MKTETPNETRYTHDFPSHYRKVIDELERENAALRSLLREAITEHVDPYDLPEGDHYIARAKAVLGIPPTQEAVTAARKEAKP